ncbi:MAG: polymerase sigma-70 factor, subfamily [Microbacteriaceae bacterium]|nr:polymerase sigma-70 factor, subfamily [Microbacteriaceae bacterium]
MTRNHADHIPPDRERDGGGAVTIRGADDGPDGFHERADRLLEASARGDQQAFAELVDTLRPRVFRRIRTVLRDAAQSEEVMQDLFLEVWRQAGRFDARRGGAVAWIMARAHARAVDRVRSVVADRERDLRVGLRDRLPEYDSVVESIEVRGDFLRVARALRRLTAVQAEAVVLAYRDGYSHAELAEKLGVPLGTIKSRIHDGMRHLREDLGVAA